MDKYLWRKKTVAPLLTMSQLRELIRGKGCIVIGLAGFSDNLEKRGGEDLEPAIQQVMEIMLKRKIKDFVPRSIFLVSGATNVGVPRIGYSVAERLGCISIGLTSEEAAKYSIALLDYLTISGKSFGDESHEFISILDELWIFGGGNQSLYECNLALEARVPLTIVQGIGEITDSLSSDTNNVTFIDIYNVEQ